MSAASPKKASNGEASASAPAPPKKAEAPRPEKGDVMIAMYDYDGKGKDELKTTKGDEIELVKVTEDTWWQAKNLTTKKKGWLSSSVIVPLGCLDLEDWCHGKITRNAAEYLLNKDKITGTFIVRESQSQPGDYTLSLMDSGKVVHYRINESEKGVGIGPSKLFPTIQEMIAHYRRKSEGIACLLTNTIPKAHAKAMIISKEMEKKWEIKRSDVVLGKLLGAGNFGEVYEGTYGKEVVAIKCIKEDSMEAQEFMQEAHVMKKLQHPNLVRLIGVCSIAMPMYIITEFVSKGDLLSYLRRPSSRKEIDTTGQLYIASQIAAGMTFLEKNKTIHRDLAARNCLVGENLVIKIADFGMGREIENLYTARTGTKMPVKWSAPEALCYNAFSIASDVWSFGIILWEIAAYGDAPYSDVESADVLVKLEEGYRMPPPKNCPPGMYDIMLQTWEMDAEKRPSFSHLLTELDQLRDSDGLPPPPKKVSVTPSAAAAPAPSLSSSSSAAALSAQSKEWRKSYKKKPEGTITPDLLDLGIELSKEAFGKSQQILRYGTEETVKAQLAELLEPSKVFIDRCKAFAKSEPEIVEQYKLASATYVALAKAKPVLAKIRPTVENMRDAMRNLNKFIKALKAGVALE